MAYWTWRHKANWNDYSGSPFGDATRMSWVAFREGFRQYADVGGAAALDLIDAGCHAHDQMSLVSLPALIAGRKIDPKTVISRYLKHDKRHSTTRYTIIVHQK